MLIRDIIAVIEAYAPVALQESWDNTGLQCGDAGAECTGVMLCVDVTPEVIKEAADKGCNLVVSHHPMIFRGLKRVVGATVDEFCIIDAIRLGVAVYSCHTALDSARGGVSYTLAENLGGKIIRALHPSDSHLLQLTVVTPRHRAEDIRAALTDAGASKSLEQDTVLNNSSVEDDVDTGIPVLSIHHEPLTSIVLTVSPTERGRITAALDGMPDTTYTFTRLEETDTGIGLGALAVLDKPMPVPDFLRRVKNACGTPVLRCNRHTLDEPVSRIAVCGGAGGEFVADAVAAGAQVYVTADLRYHDFGEWADRILLVDAGHFETESCTKSIFMQLFKEKFANFAVYISASEQNPIKYF
ncbi:MAG: Nif3-like dinuclear metal center hexameric protein [Muribaculaceae bacterium]|nr:Nif3-like dinuclear metal center hexameric protein [Muribaculaceae bacterium]